MVILDLSIVNVALPSIQVGLNFSSADLNWVVNAYAIMFGGFLMLAGRFGDVYGQRRTFVAALTLFSAASLLGGLAPTSLVLIVARGIQGLGGALMAATSLGIITANFAEGHERHRAIALWSAMNGLGGAVGVLLSGDHHPVRVVALGAVDQRPGRDRVGVRRVGGRRRSARVVAAAVRHRSASVLLTGRSAAVEPTAPCRPATTAGARRPRWCR